MTKLELANPVEAPKGFTDVLYLTSQRQMPYELKRLLKQKKVAFFVLPIEGFPSLRDSLDRVGTVIIDTEGLDCSQQQHVARIIESLEMEKIGTILLRDRPELPIRSFSVTPANTSFLLNPTIETFSIDEIWFRISINLAYRKKSTDVMVKPAIPPSESRGTHKNKLAEQLRMTQDLVDMLAEQLRMAGLVQRDFLPSQLPNTDKIRWATTFLPAEWVSGDIYDIVRLDEQHIGFYIADVVGHAMPAALLTMFLKQALAMRQTEGSTYRIFQPNQVIKNLNSRMTGQKLSGYQFATCCYCLLNTESLELSYARAGHPYPVLIRQAEKPEQLQARGSLLGVFDQAEYHQETVQLQPGDKLVLYSDGAEPFIGSLDQTRGFILCEEFQNIRHLPIVEMMERLNTIVQNKEVTAYELDDVTVIGLQINQ